MQMLDQVSHSQKLLLSVRDLSSSKAPGPCLCPFPPLTMEIKITDTLKVGGRRHGPSLRTGDVRQVYFESRGVSVTQV